MAEITIYTKDYCPYCVKAKELLKIKGRTDINEIDITTDMDKVMEMMEKTGGAKTVPQIFIGNKHVGGCDDLYAANDAGELDELLAS